ncbi:HugZ family protein [Pseudoalteromonas rubra]|uniref:Heme iron utilization protein n=1 Tax=Pseudoalteromonas rubra TaxID=43658 RepID=A0A0F4QGB4_9GAMM|nr:DUF2470 domain-containing protein [Pseudoalteromonas rubra]KJZ06339.1 heme iron utilization protein [Pseudoalteromonas rubra]
MREQAVFEARQLLRHSTVCVMSTLSKNLAGYPFGSVTPFMSDDQGRLIFYIAGIAQHSRNLTTDSRVCATIFDAAQSGDQNEHARVTIVGDATPVPDEEAAELLLRYERHFPEAISYRQAHDFKLWRMDIKRVRYIAGFGQIFWLEADEWAQPAANWDLASEAHMVAHMNDDHQDANQLILKLVHNVDAAEVTMTTILTEGCYLRANDKSYYVPFDARCEDATAVRKALVRLTKAARAQFDEAVES